MTEPRSFLDLDVIDAGQLRRILDRAGAYKRGDAARPMAGRILAMIFDKPSTRTRVSFEVAAKQLGGDAIVLTSRDMQLGRGESVADTARVLSRYVDAIMIRTDAHEKLLELAAHATVPIINGLTDRSHPCQIMADVMTIEEHRGPIRGKTLAWTGDGNNVLTSLVHAAVAARLRAEHRDAARAGAAAPALLDWAARAAGPRPADQRPDRGGARRRCGHRRHLGVDGPGRSRASVVASWSRSASTARSCAHAAEGALFLHCLPAHRGEEVTADVIDGPQSVVFDEAENRLHAQKAILEWCLAG